MRILEIIADSSLSGAPLHLLTLIKLLNKKDFDVFLICPEGWLAYEAEKLGIKTIKIRLSGFTDFSSIYKLRQKIKKINPEIIHLHGIRAGWLGVLATRGFKDKLIYTEHLYTSNYHLESHWREKIQLRGLSYILKNIRIILAPSLAVKTFLISRFNTKKEKIIIVANGLEDIRRRELGGDELKIGFIGSLNIQKGVMGLIKAFGIVENRFPNLKLEILGDGPLKKQLQQKAKKLTYNIDFLGEKFGIEKYLSKWKMLVIPSKSESFGQAAVEAAILSKPVVGTLVGGLPEVVINKETGILVDSHSYKSLAKAIIYLLEHPKKAKKMGEKARQRYEALFTAQKMVKKIEGIYRQLKIYEFRKI